MPEMMVSPFQIQRMSDQDLLRLRLTRPSMAPVIQMETMRRSRMQGQQGRPASPVPVRNQLVDQMPSRNTGLDRSVPMSPGWPPRPMTDQSVMNLQPTGPVTYDPPDQPQVGEFENPDETTMPRPAPRGPAVARTSVPPDEDGSASGGAPRPVQVPTVRPRGRTSTPPEGEGGEGAIAAPLVAAATAATQGNPQVASDIQVAARTAVGAPEKARDAPDWELPLIVAGLTMAASRAPGFAGALGEGGLAGIRQMTLQQKLVDDREAQRAERAIKEREVAAKEGEAGVKMAESKRSLDAQRLLLELPKDDPQYWDVFAMAYPSSARELVRAGMAGDIKVVHTGDGGVLAVNAKTGETIKRLGDLPPTAAGTEVNLNPGERAEDSTLGTQRATWFGDINNRAKVAAETIDQVATARAVAAPTGRLAPAREAMGSWAQALDIKMPESIAAAQSIQAFDSLAASYILGKQLEQKGVQTEADAKRMNQTFAQVRNTPAANDIILRALKAQSLRVMDQQAFAQRWLDDKKTLSGVQKAWSDFIRTTPLVARNPQSGELSFFNEALERAQGMEGFDFDGFLSQWRKVSGG